MSLISKTLANLIGGVSQQSMPLRMFNQCDQQENMRSSLINGLQSRPPLNVVSRVSRSEGAFYNIDRDTSYRYNLLVSPEGLLITDTNGVVQNVEYADGWQNYLSATVDYDPHKTYKTLTLADYTFILNTQKTVRVSNIRYEDWQNQALVFIKQVNYATTWTLTLNGQSQTFGYGGANTTNGTSAKRYVNGIESGEADGLSTAEVASNLCGSGAAASHIEYVPVTPSYILVDEEWGDHTRTVKYYQTAGLYIRKSDGSYIAAPAHSSGGTFYKQIDVAATVPAAFTEFEFVQSKSTLWIRRKDRGPFSIGVADTRGDSCITLVTSKVQQFDQLPTIAPDGYICRVVGAVANNADDYYVRFLCNSNSSFGKGAWEECAEPGSYFQLDPNTMPWTLRHVTGTSWKFMPTPWEEKTIGDLDSSPVPQFVNKKLSNIFLFANRLCFLADDLLCMSRASKHMNFWNETAITMSDSDPIYLSASTKCLSNLYDFGVLDDDLILFSTRDQYKLNSSDVLSPKTATLTAIGNNAFTDGTGVAAVGTRMYFGYKTGDFYSACEFGTSAVTGQKEAAPITSHVPSYIPFTNKLHLCGSENVSMLCVLTDSSPDTLFVYQYYITGSQKLQSAWSKYVFAGCTLRGCFFRDHMLWLMLVKNNVTLIATMDMAEHAEATTAVRFALDCATALESATPTTTFTLPDYLNGTDLVVLTLLPSGLYTETLDYTLHNNQITLTKESAKIIVGAKYKRLFVFSTQYPTDKNRSGAETAITSGRWQLQKLTLNYDLSGPYKVKVKPLFNLGSEGCLYNTEGVVATPAPEGFHYRFNGIVVGTQTAIIGNMPMTKGAFTVPLRGRNTDLSVEIESDSWIPEAFISAEWQGLYITKVKQV